MRPVPRPAGCRISSTRSSLPSIVSDSSNSSAVARLKRCIAITGQRISFPFSSNPRECSSLGWGGLDRPTPQVTPRGGTGILFEEPNPTGSRPRGLIGLYKRWHQEERPQPAKRSNREEGGGDRHLFKRETDHLWLRQQRVVVYSRGNRGVAGFHADTRGCPQDSDASMESHDVDMMVSV